MYIIKMLAVAFCVALSLKVHANSSFNPNKIQGIVIHDDGHSVLIYGASDFVHSEGCPSKRFLVLDKTHPNYQAIYSALLSAYHAQTSFRGWINGCTYGGGNLTRLDLGEITY